MIIMMECLHNTGLENFENDDLVQILRELHDKKGVLEEALACWRHKYEDVIDDTDDCVETMPTERLFSDDRICSLTVDDEDFTDISGTYLRRRTSSRISANQDASMQCKDSNDDTDSWKCDQYVCTDALDHENRGYEEHYFEVTSSQNCDDENDAHNSSMQSLIQRLKETKEKVAAKCSDFGETIASVGREATESCSLRERIGMTHRSLTLLEMRQEKVMREALYENVTANCSVRKLQDEVIQLRIRDTQHQGDIQRLMAENSRLKLKLMEARIRQPGSSKPTPRKYQKIAPEIDDLAPKFTVQATSKIPGLSEIDDLCRPICVGAIHRGSLSLFKDKIQTRLVPSSGEISTTISDTLVQKHRRCPLCNRNEDFDVEEEEEYEETRSVGTSTADIENIVATRNTICIMGMRLPIPLFLACVLRSLEETMAMIGRVCFAEIPPFDPSFPELQGDVIDSLNLLYQRVADLYK